MEINIKHIEMTDEEFFQKLKKLYKEYPSIFMSPKKWKKERLKQLEKEGKKWSY